VIKVPVPVRAIVHHDQLSILTIIIISAMRFGRGGSARLARLAINHHAAIRGRAICSPRASTIVRV